MRMWLQDTGLRQPVLETVLGANTNGSNVMFRRIPVHPVLDIAAEVWPPLVHLAPVHIC